MAHVIPYRGRVAQTIRLDAEQIIQLEAIIARRIRAEVLSSGDTAPNRITRELDVAISHTIATAIYEAHGIGSADVRPEDFEVLYWSAHQTYADVRREQLRTRGVA